MDQPLRCEFSPALATVVGSSTGGETTTAFRTIVWDGLSSPHELEGVPLAIRTQRPVSEPVFRTVQSNTGGQSRQVLVNEPSAGQNLHLGPNQQRPSLWIDFASPQRAVGLEYGYEPLPDTPRDELIPEGLLLIAYNTEGVEITRSHGGVSGAGVGTVLASNDFAQIGVHDKDGQIRTVELRFTREHPNRIDGDGVFLHEPQVVSRIWFEPLPPAVVKQGVLGIDVNWTPNTPGVLGDAPLSTLYPDLTQAPIELPFKTDSAVAFVRGYSLKFADYQARPVDHLSAGIEIAQANRTITLTPVGHIGTPTAANAPFRLIVYYTLVAWDSSQVELRTATADERRTTSTTENSGFAHFIDPCPGCGALFAGLQRMDFSLPRPRELEVWQFMQGYQRGFAAPVMVNNSLANGAWSIYSRIIPDGNPGYTHTIAGAVLSGRGLRLGVDDVSDLEVADRQRVRASETVNEFPITSLRVGPRAAESFVYPISERSSLGWSWPVTGDIAFLSLGMFNFSPEGPLSSVSIEARAEYYNGRILDWQLGLGLSATSLIVPDSGRLAMGLPVFGAIQRHDALDEPTIEATPLVIADAPVGCSTGVSAQAGSLRNRGRGQALIREVETGSGADDHLFEYQFEWRGQHLTLDDLRDRLPLQLRPGEALLVRAVYAPDRAAGTTGTSLPPHHATIDFHTAHPAYPNVRMSVSGRTTGPVTGNAQGSWQPVMLDFGFVPVGQELTLDAVLVSTGSRPLCVTQMSLLDNTKGFRFVPGPQADPARRTVRVTFTSAPSGLRGIAAELGRGGSTELIAQTNAGTLRLALAGNILSVSRGPSSGTPVPQPDIPVCMTPEDYFRGCRNP